ncbi:Conserved_hypothetical protein [Hexamita inflata]|uniref:Uncharacterized protein n=1 Tax=Hexamita inflata TaxID=28002 RepID=A0AA86R903_9EUKA|nr:Conserved hypothetical protein [Hexamita inflata]
MSSSQALTDKAFELVKKSEQELLEWKQKYNSLLQDFNFNLNLIRERDHELDTNAIIIKELEVKNQQVKDYDELKQQLILTQSQMQNVQNAHNQLKQDYKLQLSKQGQISQQYSELETALEKQKIMNESLTIKYNDAVQQLSEYKCSVKELSNAQNQTTKEQYAVKSENELLRTQLEQAKADLEIFKAKLSNTDTQQRDMRQQNQELLYDNKKLSDEYLAVKQQLEKSNQLQVRSDDTLSQLIEKYKTDTRQLKQANKQLKNELNALENKSHESLERFQAYVTEQTAREESYESMLKKSATNINQLENEVQTLKQQLQQLDKQYINQITQLQANLNLTQTQGQNTQSKMQHKYSQLETDNVLLKQQISELNCLCEDLKREVALNQNSKAKEVMRDMRVHLETTIQQLKDAKTDLTQKEALFKQQITDQQSQFTQMQSNLKSEVSNLQQTIQTQKQLIQDLEFQIQKYKTQIILNSPSNPIENELIEKLKTKLAEAAQQLRTILNENEQYEKQIKQLQNENKKQIKQIAQLNKQIKTIENNNNNFEEEQNENEDKEIIEMCLPQKPPVKRKMIKPPTFKQPTIQDNFENNNNNIEQPSSTQIRYENKLRKELLENEEIPSALFETDDLKDQIQNILKGAGV